MIDGKFSLAASLRQAIAMAAAALCLAAPMSASAAESDLILRKESVYNSIFVFQEGPYRILRFGNKNRFFRESTYNPDDPAELPAVYTRFATLGVAYAEKLEKAAVIGLGGGRTTWYLSHFLPELRITAVELDPEIVKIADEYFDVREGANLDIVTQDGRIFMRRNDETFDYIVVDAYRGHFVPFHLLTQEFYELIETRLSPGGAVVQNIAPNTMLFDHALATINSVFDNVDLYEANLNIVAIAYNGPRKTQSELMARAAPLQETHGFRYDLEDMIGLRMDEQPWDSDKILTDDFAPANYLKSIERHNERTARD
jgi:spermidine synthase